MADPVDLKPCVKEAGYRRPNGLPWCVVHDAPFSELDDRECLGRYLDEEGW